MMQLFLLSHILAAGSVCLSILERVVCWEGGGAGSAGDVTDAE